MHRRPNLFYFFASIPFAFVWAIIPAPTIRSPEAAGFEMVVPALWLIACGLVFYGWYTRVRRYVIEATLLLWFAADLYWLSLVVINQVVSPPPFGIPNLWWHS